MESSNQFLWVAILKISCFFSNPVKHPLQKLRDGCKRTKRKYSLRGNRERYKVHTAQAF
jgi:hypothetical protein